MKFGFPGGPRLEWYDRNPTRALQAYRASGVAPHASTQRWTYTVPAGKKAIVEFVFIEVMRETAASAVQTAGAFILLTPSGGSENYVVCGSLLNNNVGTRVNEIAGLSMFLLAGDVIRAITYDGSTGGTCGYAVVAKITEFDA